MGYSFAAGTIDGPGSFSFRQGTTSANPMWNVVRNLLATPTNEDIKCHGAKPILLATGHVSLSILIMKYLLRFFFFFIIYLPIIELNNRSFNTF